MPHRSHISYRSRASVYGIFDDLEHVRDFTQHLLDLGLGDEQVQVLMGEDGARELDRDGQHHGLIRRLIRYVQSITDEREHVETYVHALLQGRYVVSVLLPPRRQDALQQVAGAFRACHGHFVNHYGVFVVQQLSA
ncbi:hypothetical protein [Deinococcus maricopensis]|uniref:Uncharacterized protein n=1 Tax=Deinococcus maricopensis (strain DSM 21211 / LMG 22137 / NRRL B-23946 / LB-34) TaxID=709986 RepID=E8UA58_DEIML|nr:hypothetical protein [Deinococcus maricopensis]ADV67947.1 hypothetical protein Deima_2309 [Deinococcus maricopensis DSM 21211]